MRSLFLLLILLAAAPLWAVPPYAYVSNGADTVWAVDWQTNNVVATIPITTEGSPAVTPNGEYIYVSDNPFSNPPTSSMISTNTNTVVKSNLPLPLIDAIAPSGQLLYSINYTNYSTSVQVTCGITYAVLANIPVDFDSELLLLSPDGRYLYTFSTYNVDIIDTTTRAVAAKIKLGSSSPYSFIQASAAVMSPDGAFIYLERTTEEDSPSLEYKTYLSVFSTATNTVVADIIDNHPGPQAGAPIAMAISPNGESVYLVRDTFSPSYSLYEEKFSTAINSFVSSFTITGEYATAMAVTPDGASLYLLTGSDLRVISTAINKVVKTIGIAGGYVVMLPQPPSSSGPEVVSLKALYGKQSYELVGSTRKRLPWRITGVQAVFSEPIAKGSAKSLTGVNATSVNGVGSNTLTWTIEPLTNSSTTLHLLATGPDGLRGDSGEPLTGGKGYEKSIKILTGDFNDDGVVNATDITGLLNAHTQPFNIYADINGDRTAGDLADINLASTNLGKTNH